MSFSAFGQCLDVLSINNMVKALVCPFPLGINKGSLEVCYGLELFISSVGHSDSCMGLTTVLDKQRQQIL